jgi:hypothetical protein
MFVAVNCTDSACQQCSGVKIVPFGKCTQVLPLGYVLVTKVFHCGAIVFENFAGADCSGTNWSYMMPSGQCYNGQIVSGC